MKPLLAFSGVFWDGSSGLGLADGLRSAGFDVAMFDLDRYIPSTDGDLLLRAARRVLSPRAVARYREWLVATCTRDRPDVFLSIKGACLDPGTLTTIKRQGALLAMFYPDVAFDHRGVDTRSFELYDFIFTTKRFHLPWMQANVRGPRIHHVDHGYSTRTHLADEPFDLAGARFDVGFVGNHSAYKQRWLAALVALRPHLTIAIAGPNWIRPTRGSILEDKVVGEMTGASYRRFISRCRINVALHHGPTTSGWSDDVSTRTFEIPAARGFMLHIDNDEVRVLFDVGREIDTFVVPEDLAEKIDFYLAHPERRGAMIDAAFRRAVPAYSYDARAMQMAELMGFNPPALASDPDVSETAPTHLFRREDITEVDNDR